MQGLQSRHSCLSQTISEGGESSLHSMSNLLNWHLSNTVLSQQYSAGI